MADKTNMATEGMLAQFRCATGHHKRKPSIDRFVSSTALSAQHKLFRDAGGLDYRKEQVYIDNCPVRTRLKVDREVRRADAIAKQVKYRNGYQVYADETYPSWAAGRKRTGEAKDRGTYNKIAGAAWQRMGSLEQAPFESRAMKTKREHASAEPP